MIIFIYIYIYIYTYQHLQRGAKWFLKGFNSPSLRVQLASLEGPGISLFLQISNSKNKSIKKQYIYIHIHMCWPFFWACDSDSQVVCGVFYSRTEF